MPGTEKIRVRFAPSPTGHLHIGGVRTALFNWLFARHGGGVFILRIEDTDRSRSTDEYIESILEGMRWLNLDWDEGPFRQTERFDIYRSHIDKLLESGRAYRCYCSQEELEEKRKKAAAEGRPLSYDGRCRDIETPPSGITPSVRFRMPKEGRTVVDDLIKGTVVFENDQLDDLIIMRSDGTPTYNFVVVADDVDMGITHVIRGDDHLNNTPKQIHIYSALGHAAPAFGHLPMILGEDKARLSKRHGATSVIAYRDMGYLSDALVNYLVRLGWSYGDQEVFGREELIRYFSLENIGKSAAVFNPEKLLWLNAEYMKTTPPERLAELVMPFLKADGTVGPDDEIDDEMDKVWLSKAILTLTERAKTLVELSKSLRYYILEHVEIDEKAGKKFLNEKTLPYLKDIKEGLSGLEGFTGEGIQKVFNDITQKHGIKLGAVAQPVRVAVMGKTESPGIFEVLEVLGREKALKRMEKAIQAAGTF
ncbi:MAG: glutamate--tRNA ligase [Thermodesulfovibrionales bacterium]|nr:glutamate--tRNA ligase [Thermodesulfovibrionales bacterium]